MTTAHLGEPLTGSYAVAGGEARLYERGATINGSAGEVVLAFNLPMIGAPRIAVGSPGAATPLDPGAVTFEAGAWDLETLRSIIHAALADRLVLLPTGQPPNPVPIAFGAPEVVIPAGGGAHATYGLPSTASLQERQLYDVAVRADDGQWKTIAPHAIYFRSTWNDFGIAHVTDIHLARRIDYFPGRLEQLGRPEAAQKMYNWNDRFRGFIRYANYLHGIGMLDVILATGDIIDYVFEDDDDQNGGGNAAFAREILLGRAPSPGFEQVEELRVPIFMVGGNHDYRKHAYKLLFNLDLGLVNAHQFQNFSGYHLQWKDGLALSRGDNGDEVPERSRDSAAKMVEIDTENRAFTTYLADLRSYVVPLGAHRIAMLDSSWDLGVVTGVLDFLATELGVLPEDHKTFVGGSPNSEGVSDRELKLVADALQDTPDGALVIVGIHAPLFNAWGNEYPYFLRETQRAALAASVVPYLSRHDATPVPVIEEHVRRKHLSWFATDGQGEPTFVKRGDNDDLLDYGVSRGKANELLQLIAGVGSRRKADVVLSGHEHRYNEFRLGSTDGELAYFMDFYTHNPAHYYPTRFATMPHPPVMESEVTYVDIVHAAPASAQPSAMPYEAMHKHVVQVPPYPNPLATAQDVRGWWAEHRPLVLQSAALGPLEDSQVSFSGFRLLSVKDDTIDKIHFVSTERLHASGYRLPWEEASRPEAPRRHLHRQRSREHDAPAAAGAPHGYLAPVNGVQNIVYRDTQGRLIELWRDAAGATGTGNLTQAAGATTAKGDPYVYLDTTAGLQIVLYRGSDGNVRSLYWSTGNVGHDDLSGSVGAPKAAGNPVGFFTAASNLHHVIYRAGDGHLHALWWTGQEAVGHADVTADSGALPAAGDPSVILDTARGDNIIFYRASDDHIHSVYWSTGPFGHEDLSGFAQAPGAAGDPFAFYTPHDDAKQVTYRGTDGHIHELYWGGTNPVSHWDLTAVSGAPAAAGDPVSFYSAHTNTKHVIYRAADGHLIELWWVPGGGTPAPVDLSAMALAPPAVETPGAFASGPARHVVYRATDNQIHEIRWE